MINRFVYLRGEATSFSSAPIHSLHLLICIFCPLFENDPELSQISLRLWPPSIPSKGLLLLLSPTLSSSVPFQPSPFFPPLLSAFLLVLVASRDRSAMSWGTWGPLLMVTNDWLCSEGKRKSAAERGEESHRACWGSASSVYTRRKGGESFSILTHDVEQDHFLSAPDTHTGSSLTFEEMGSLFAEG